MLKGKKFRIGLSLVLIIAVLIIPIASFGDDAEDTEKYAARIGSYVDVYGANNPNGVEGEKTGAEFKTSNQTLDNGLEDPERLYMDYSKSIESTSTEDLFKITLKVETNDITKVVPETTDVLLVFDVSGSMDYKVNSNKKAKDGETSRWDLYKKAMNDFLDEFLTSVPGNRVAIVAFAGSSYHVQKEDAGTNDYTVLQNWTTSVSEAKGSFDYNSTEALRDSKSGDLKDINTNAEAGAIGGLTMVPGSSDSKYGALVFVSDGAANTWSSDGYTSDWNTNSFEAAKDKLNALRSKIEKTYGEENTKSYGFAIGEEAAGQQLMKFVLQKRASATWFDEVFTTGADDNNIADKFTDIGEALTVYRVNTWDVIDPMSKWVTFENFANEDDETNNSATWISEDNTIKWNLEGTNYMKTGSTYTYVLSYFVKLDKTAEGFKSGEFYPTNKETTIEYGFTTESSEVEKKTALFKIPTVCGYLPSDGTVAGETSNPEQTGQVLPDTENPESSVLGEEAKTSDSMNWIILAIIALIAVIAIVAVIVHRKKAAK